MEGCIEQSLSTQIHTRSGTAQLFISRALQAVLSIELESYRWLNVSGNNHIGKQIRISWAFTNCVGLMYGTI